MRDLDVKLQRKDLEEVVKQRRAYISALRNFQAHTSAIFG
jgi:hypothetical protein